MIFVTRAEVEALLRHEKERVSLTATCLNVKPPYLPVTVAKPHTSRYRVPNFHMFDCHKGNTRERVPRFLDPIGLFAHMLICVFGSFEVMH